MISADTQSRNPEHQACKVWSRGYRRIGRAVPANALVPADIVAARSRAVATMSWSAGSAVKRLGQPAALHQDRRVTQPVAGLGATPPIEPIVDGPIQHERPFSTFFATSQTEISERARPPAARAR